MLSIGFGIVSQPLLAQQITIKVLDTKSQPVTDVVVYLELPEGMTTGISQQVVEVTQADKAFTPYVAVMQKGASAKFQNNDDITHHIYSPVGDNKFEFKLSAGQERLKHDFSASGEVAMGCNIHDWMSGHLLIVDTPYFAKTNAQGVATINVADQGRYNVVVWHPQLREVNHRLSVLLDTAKNSSTVLRLSKPMAELPTQKNEDDFDFLSDY